VVSIAPQRECPSNHDQPRAELLSGEFDTADQRRGNDVAGNSNDKQIPQSLIRIRSRRERGSLSTPKWPQRFLTCRQFQAARPAFESIPAGNLRRRKRWFPRVASSASRAEIIGHSPNASRKISAIRRSASELSVPKKRARQKQNCPQHGKIRVE